MTCLLLGAVMFIYFAKDLPDPEDFNQIQIAQSTKIYDRTGKIILYDIHEEEKRTVIPTNQIPEHMKQATVAIEDDNFYNHIGVDIKGIIRAFFTNLKGQRLAQGGSTITQQFIKNSILTPEKTLTRKIKEAILALEMERKYSKEEILSFYLNQVPYGSNAYGIEAAAQTFFSKSAQDLTLAECALLASLPQATTYYSPYGSHTDTLKARQEHTLDRMHDLGYISLQETKEAKEEELKFSRQSHGIKAPHFVMYIREYLEEKYGNDYIEKAGLKVYTTLDYELQQVAEEAVAEGAEKNTRYNASNAALIAINPKTGQILSMVGSKDYFDIENQGNFNVAISPNRQPGSSFKPFAYAAAFEKGYTPETILFDLQTSFGEFGPAYDRQEYIPRNYDGRFRGPVTMRSSLAQSLNVTSVKTLYLADLDRTINLAQDMGITTLKNRNRYNLSLVLGGGEVKLLDEVAAYSVFANEGIKNPTAAILKIENNKGEVLEEFKAQPVEVLDKQVARQVNNILSDNEARTPAFGPDSYLYLGSRPVAAKTGTTQEYRDGWTVGYTPEIAAGAWAGNNNNKPMALGASGSNVAAPIWYQFMKDAYKIKNQEKKEDENKEEEINENYFSLSKTPVNFNPPTPTPSSTKSILRGEVAYDRTVEVDSISGKLATDLTPPELIKKETFKEIHCILYYVDKDNPQGDIPENPEQDPQFLNWEKPVLSWVQKNLCSEPSCPNYNQGLPNKYDDIHTPENQPEIEITLPNKGEKINNSNLIIKVKTEASLNIKQVDFFFNNNLIGTDHKSPYELTFKPGEYISNSNEKQFIKARVYDEALNRKEDEIYIYLD